MQHKDLNAFQHFQSSRSAINCLRPMLHKNGQCELKRLGQGFTTRKQTLRRAKDVMTKGHWQIEITKWNIKPTLTIFLQSTTLWVDRGSKKSIMWCGTSCRSSGVTLFVQMSRPLYIWNQKPGLDQLNLRYRKRTFYQGQDDDTSSSWHKLNTLYGEVRRKFFGSTGNA